MESATNLKVDMERLLTSRETGSKWVAPKLEACCNWEITMCSDPNQSFTGVTLKPLSISCATFDGRCENCATFENMFKVMVDNRTDITAI
jgi:hypothetical protein